MGRRKRIRLRSQLEYGKKMPSQLDCDVGRSVAPLLISSGGGGGASGRESPILGRRESPILGRRESPILARESPILGRESPILGRRESPIMGRESADMSDKQRAEAIKDRRRRAAACDPSACDPSASASSVSTDACLIC